MGVRTDSVDAKWRTFVRLLRKRQIAKTFGINFKIYSIKKARKKDQKVHLPHLCVFSTWLKVVPPILLIQTAFNKAEEDNTFRDLHNSSNHTKDESNNFFIIYPKKIVILKPAHLDMAFMLHVYLDVIFPSSKPLPVPSSFQITRGCLFSHTFFK